MANVPLVIEIKGNSLDDGPGIRSSIFFKGCPLSCIWCHNPESKKVYPELSYDGAACIGCGTCIEECPNGALSPENKGFVDREKCKACFACTTVCPAKALTRVGTKMSQDEILEKVLSDKPFFDVSGGGVTLTGGEATMCMEWVGELAEKFKENGVNVLLETCGMFDFEKAENLLLPYLTDIYCDVKIFDREAHKKYCGVYNDVILENLKKMFDAREKLGYNLLPRTPLVPDITDTDENLTAIAEYYVSIGINKTELLPYNPTWYSKNDKLGIHLDDALKDITGWQSKEKISAAKEIFTSRGIECK